MSLASPEVGKYYLFFQLPIWKRAGFPNSMLSLFSYLMDLCIFVYIFVTRFAEKPSEQDSLDADCCELLHPGHGVWQSDVLSTHREGDSACA